MKTLIFILVILSSPIFSQISVEFEVLSPTCSTGDCNGQIQAQGLNGLAPYSYNWFDAEIASSDSATAINLCGGTHRILITDALGSVLDTSVFLNVYPTPEIEIDIQPGDTLYLQNPTAAFNFTNLDEADIPLDGWLWGFGDGNTSSEISSNYTYTDEGIYEISLRVIHHGSCDTIFYHELAVKTIELFIPNIITPNGDGQNDKFIITSINDAESSSYGGKQSVINDFYISNELVIYNRWSQKVYDAKNYVNDWDGGDLTDGVYFYVLKCVGEFGTDVFKGSITILASGH